MQRTPITDKLNPSKPYNLDFEHICYGKAWNPTNAICKNCNAIHGCGTAQFNTNLDKQDELKAGTPFLSECSFDKVAENSLLWTIKETKLVTYEDLLQIISEYSGFKDKVTLTNYLNQFLNRHNLIIEDGIIK